MLGECKLEIIRISHFVIDIFSEYCDGTIVVDTLLVIPGSSLLLIDY